MRRRVLTSVSLLLLALLASAGLSAQAPAQTPTQFYTAYLEAFDKAQKVEDLFPFMAAERRKEIEATPPAERTEMFQFVKMFAVRTNVKVLKEERTATGAVLTVEGLDGDKKKSSGKITLVREGGAWKMTQESWSSSS